MPQKSLLMPIGVFVEAVKKTVTPCEKGQKRHQAVQYMTDWWNATAEPAFRCAYGFALYVRRGEDWLSGTPEEGLVDRETWKRNEKPNAQATLLDGKVTIWFFTNSVDETPRSFNAKSVDGSEGVSGGKWEEITGDGLVTFDSYEALSLIPARFPDIWQEACAALAE